MKKITKNVFGSLLIGISLALAAVVTPLVPASTTYAACVYTDAAGNVIENPTKAQMDDPANKLQLDAGSGIDCAQGDGTPDNLFGAGSIFTTIVNVLLFVIGAISVIMLIIGGIRYTTSAGDSGNVTAAKNTIMYAIIGLVIAFLAFAVVNWVLGAITPAPATE